METETHTVRRYRVYQAAGLVVGALFLALGTASFLLGGGWIVGVIALAGGALCVVASLVMMVRTRA